MIKAAKLYRKHTMTELLAMQEEIVNDPSNKAAGGIFKYTSAAMKKLDELAWAITYHLREKNPQPQQDHGYTGRKSKKR